MYHTLVMLFTMLSRVTNRNFDGSVADVMVVFFSTTYFIFLSLHFKTSFLSSKANGVSLLSPSVYLNFSKHINLGIHVIKLLKIILYFHLITVLVCVNTQFSLKIISV